MAYGSDSLRPGNREEQMPRTIWLLETTSRSSCVHFLVLVLSSERNSSYSTLTRSTVRGNHLHSEWKPRPFSYNWLRAKVLLELNQFAGHCNRRDTDWQTWNSFQYDRISPGHPPLSMGAQLSELLLVRSRLVCWQSSCWKRSHQPISSSMEGLVSAHWQDTF